MERKGNGVEWKRNKRKGNGVEWKRNVEKEEVLEKGGIEKKIEKAWIRNKRD